MEPRINKKITDLLTLNTILVNIIAIYITSKWLKIGGRLESLHNLIIQHQDKIGAELGAALSIIIVIASVIILFIMELLLAISIIIAFIQLILLINLKIADNSCNYRVHSRLAVIINILNIVYSIVIITSQVDLLILSISSVSILLITIITIVITVNDKHTQLKQLKIKVSNEN